MSELAQLFSEDGYRFHLTLGRGELREFLRPQDSSGRLLEERRRWIAQAPERYAVLRPAGEAVFAEFNEWFSAGGGERFASIRELGAGLEPDVLFLAPDEEGRFRLQGGALCFPTGWALEEKLGEPLEAIHGVVPGLNTAIGPAIQQFLQKLRPGRDYLRDNWGIAATDALNLHPTRSAPELRRPVSLDEMWLRVEHQILAALPETQAIVFGIRVKLHRLDDVARDEVAARRMARELATMPLAMARYKRLDEVREELIAQLS